MTTSLVDDIKHIYARAIERVRADSAVKSTLSRDGDNVRIRDITVDTTDEGVYLIAFGKAAVGMSAAAVEQLGDLVRAGIVVTKAEQERSIPRVEIMYGAHPVPDQRSLDAGEAIAAFARDIPAGALVICLISGGGSALVEALQEGVSLDTLQSVTRSLLGAGASIQELNAVRSRLSRLKGGGLGRLLAHTSVINLIVSDVLGDELQAIASGPTVPADARISAEEVLTRYDVTVTLPEPMAASDDVADPMTFVIANVALAVDTAAQAAREMGYRPLILTTSIDGEAREMGRFIGSILRDARRRPLSLASGDCLIAGGEMVVTLRGDGIGGRNTEAALAAALRMSGTEDVAVGFLATDGDDGVSGAAGAIVTGDTLQPDDVAEARVALDANDSYTRLHAREATWTTGASGTNVNDLIIALIG